MAATTKTSSSAKTSTTTKTTAKKSTPKKASTATKTTAKKSTPKKASTAKKTTAKSTATGSTATAATTPLLAREPRTLVVDAGFAAAGLATDVLDRVRQLPVKVDTIRTDLPQKLEKQLGEIRAEAPAKAKAAPATVKARVRDQRTAVESQLNELRTKATAELATKRASFESSFDQRATKGRKVTADLQKDARYARVEGQLKAATTSVKRSVDALVDAGRSLVS